MKKVIKPSGPLMHAGSRAAKAELTVTNRGRFESLKCNNCGKVLLYYRWIDSKADVVLNCEHCKEPNQRLTIVDGKTVDYLEYINRKEK